VNVSKIDKWIECMRTGKASSCGQILMVLALAAIACHSRAAAATNLCSLLTTQEVGAALHEQIGPPQAIQTGGCIWRGSGTDSVTLEAPGTGRPGFDNAKSRMPAAVSLAGVGDAAFAFTSLAGFVEVGLVKRGTFLTVLVQTGGGKGAQAAASSLSAKIAGRL
jgi:hypothetical protein